MNILFHCWEFPPHPGGVGRYIRNMAESLASLGQSVVVTAGRSNGAKEVEKTNNVTIYRCFGRNEIYKTHTAEKILSISRRHNIDIIEGADHLGSSSQLLVQQNRPSVVIKCHSCSILKVSQEDAHIIYHWQKWLIKLARLRGYKQAFHEKRSIERADILTAPSRKIIFEMEKQGIALPQKKLIIPNPINIIERSGEEASAPTVLFVGRIDVGKGIQYLPDILSKVREKIPNVCLEVIGQDSYARGLGSLTAWLNEGFAAKNLKKNVLIHGYFNEKGVDSALDRAWVVVVPSRWDTFPTVLLEAMAKGKALVVSPNGGIPEIVAGTDIPIRHPEKLEFSHEIISLLENKEKRLNVGLSGKIKAVSFYSPEKVAENYIRMISDQLD